MFLRVKNRLYSEEQFNKSRFWGPTSQEYYTDYNTLEKYPQCSGELWEQLNYSSPVKSSCGRNEDSDKDFLNEGLLNEPWLINVCGEMRRCLTLFKTTRILMLTAKSHSLTVCLNKLKEQLCKTAITLIAVCFNIKGKGAFTK